MISPAGICRRAAAAGVRAVDHVVVDERGTVKKFDDRSETNGAGTIFTGVGVGEKEQRGAQALAASTEKIAGDFTDGLIRGGALSGKLLLDQNEVVANQIENFLDRQKRDGTSPWAGLAAGVFVLVGRGLKRPRPGNAEESPEICRGGGGDFFRC